MKWKDRPIVAFDTETTGLEPFGGDRIIEFAAVVFSLDASGRVVNREDHSFMVNPTIPIPRKVTEITGISDADVANAHTFEHHAARVRELFTDAITIAHNYPFDLAFLREEFRRIDMTWNEPLAEVDTVDLSIKHFPDARSHKLGDLARRLDVVLENAHRATDDAAACGNSFIELARRREVEDDLQAMLDWANAIGRPPPDGPFEADAHGVVRFREGPHAGKPVAEYPLHLQWMEKAVQHTPKGWVPTHPESVKRWIRRWLDVRGAGRATQNPKSFHAQDWVVEPCIAVHTGS